MIKRSFEEFNNKNILIIGDVMVDAYMWGKVDRISPEAPVPVVSVNKRENRPGGAANVALNINSLGANAILCSVIGNDERGNEFFDLMHANNLSTEGIVIDNSRITTVKTRIISDGQHLLRVDEENTDNLESELEGSFIKYVKNILISKNIDAIIFQDYDKGVITRQVIKEISHLAKEKKIPVTVDPKKRNFNYYDNVTLFKPNFKELTEGLKIEVEKSDYNAISEIAQQFAKERNTQMVFITLSELGVLLCESNKYHHVPARVRDIVDVSGAGDTVISVAGLALAAGLEPADIAYISNLAGGLVCEKVGVAPIDKQLLLNELILR